MCFSATFYCRSIVNSLDFTLHFYIPFCYCLFIFIFVSITTSMARNSLLCADVPLRNCSLTHASVLGHCWLDTRNNLRSLHMKPLVIWPHLMWPQNRLHVCCEESRLNIAIMAWNKFWKPSKLSVYEHCTSNVDYCTDVCNVVVNLLHGSRHLM